MDFQVLAKKWVDDQIKLYERKIEERRAEYRRKKWKWSESAVSDFNRRISELKKARTQVDNELTLGKNLGSSLLILANIVYNEAGTANQKAKVAVAYAWLNRTGAVREPTGSEISEYTPLLDRWNDLGDDRRLTFLQNFATSLIAARQRLNEPAPSKKDPAKGATSWVSPISLPVFRNQNGRYARTVGKAKNRAFPNWARSTSDPTVAKMKKRGQLASNYAEITVTGVDQADFLFYVGVK